MSNTIKRICSVLLAAWVLFGTVGYAFGLQTNATHTLTVQFTPMGMPAADEEFFLYRVADLTSDSSLALTDSMQILPLDLEALSADGLEKHAFTFENYVMALNIPHDHALRLDQNGKGEFTNLQDGIYLGIGQPVTLGGVTYFPQSFLVRLSDSITVEPKYASSSDRTDSLTIQKQWADTHKKGRPETVTLQLYENHQCKAIVTLTEETKWRYTWENLDPRNEYHIIESPIPQGYSVSLSRQEGCLIITNTRTESTNTPTDAPTQTPNDTLPQTGMLWWPVPLLAAVGLLLLLMGWLLKRKD